MAEPTLRDVLDAIARLRAEAATKSDLAALDAKMDARFDRLEKRLDEVDEDLTGHMKVHRKLEEDIAALKGRPPRTAARPTRRPRTR